MAQQQKLIDSYTSNQMKMDDIKTQNTRLQFQRLSLREIDILRDFKCSNENQMQVKFIYSQDTKVLLTTTYDAVFQIFNYYGHPINKQGIKNMRLEPTFDRNQQRKISSYLDSNSKTTKFQLLNQIKDFFNQHDYQFNVLYFVGHGIQLNFQGQEQTYFCWYHHQKLEYISFSQIVNLWLPKKTKYLMIIFNGCHSENWVKQLRQSPKRGSITLVSSCQQKQTSQVIQISKEDFKKTWRIQEPNNQELQMTTYISITYFTLAFFKCFLAKIHNGKLTKETIQQILATFKSQNIKIHQKFGFQQILAFLTYDHQYYHDVKYQRLTPANNASFNMDLVTSVFTGDQRENQSNQEKLGIFHKRKLGQRSQLFYEGGFKDFQFDGLGRAYLKNTNKDQYRFARYKQQRLSQNHRKYFGKSFINGQTFLIRNLERQSNLFQNYFFNIQTTASIPDKPYFSNFNIQVSYSKSHQTEGQIKHDLNLGFRKGIRVLNFLTLTTRISEQYPFKRRVQAKNFMQNSNDFFQFCKTQKKIKKIQKEFHQKYQIRITNKKNGILRLCFTFNYVFEHYKIRISQIKPIIRFGIPTEFHYRNLLDQILLKDVTYVFKEFYDESTQQSVSSVYYLQNYQRYKQACDYLMIAKIKNYIEVQTNAINKRFNNKEFKNSCYSKIGTSIHKFLKIQPNYQAIIINYLQNCYTQLSQINVQNWQNQTSKNNDLKALSDLIQELVKFVKNEERMKVWKQQITNFNLRNVTTFQ